MDLNAFLQLAFQSGAFQEEAATEGWAFQQCAFQDDAFQADACNPVPVFGGSGVGGGSTSGWRRKKKWQEYTYSKSQRYEELYQKLLAEELELERAKELEVETAITELTQRRIAKVRTRVTVIKERLAQIAAYEEDEEHLMIALLA